MRVMLLLISWINGGFKSHLRIIENVRPDSYKIILNNGGKLIPITEAKHQGICCCPSMSVWFFMVDINKNNHY